MTITIRNEDDAWLVFEKLSAHSSPVPDIRFDGWPIVEISTRQNEAVAKRNVLPVSGHLAEVTTGFSKLHLTLQTDLHRLAALFIKGTSDARRLKNSVKSQLNAVGTIFPGGIQFDLSGYFNSLERATRGVRDQRKRMKGIVAVALALGSTIGVAACISGVSAPKLSGEVKGHASIGYGGVEAQFEFGFKGTLNPLEESRLALLEKEKSESATLSNALNRVNWWPEAMRLAPEEGELTINGLVLHAKVAQRFVQLHAQSNREDEWKAVVTPANSIEGWGAKVVKAT